MADTIDEVNDNIQRELEQAINSNRAKIEQKFYKLCLNCYEETEDGAKFCDKDCADDYEKRKRANQMKH